MAKISSEGICEDSDVVNDSETPLVDRFYTNGGSKTLLQMTNFTFCEMSYLWHCCHNLLSNKFTLEQGKKQMWHQKIFSLLSCVLWKLQQIGIQWVRFLKKKTQISEAFFLDRWHLEMTPLSRLHLSYFATLSMTTLVNKCALYATDMIVQHENCQSRNLLERKVCFSGKHKLYGFKTKSHC